MNVGQLIEKLNQYPQNTRVVISGYEGGLSDVRNTEEKKIALNVNDAWYYGDHEEHYDSDSHDGHDIVPAIKIS